MPHNFGLRLGFYAYKKNYEGIIYLYITGET